MTNFYRETLGAIEESGHSIDDVMFIGSNDGELRMSWEQFIKVSDFEYDSGFGGALIPSDLIIYFNDNTYIARGEYDGSEWWEVNVKRVFTKDDKYEEIFSIPTYIYGSLLGKLLCPKCRAKKSPYDNYCEICTINQTENE